MAHTWFLDRTHQGKEAGRQLKKAGVEVVKHKQRYEHQDDLADPIWIRDVAAQGWLIISGDKGLELDGVNRYEVIKSRAKVFILEDTHSRGIDWACALVSGRQKIERIAQMNEGPFFVTIERSGDVHVRNLRFVGTGGPKALDDTTAASDQQETRSRSRRSVPSNRATTLQTEMFAESTHQASDLPR